MATNSDHNVKNWFYKCCKFILTGIGVIFLTAIVAVAIAGLASTGHYIFYGSILGLSLWGHGVSLTLAGADVHVAMGGDVTVAGSSTGGAGAGPPGLNLTFIVSAHNPKGELLVRHHRLRAEVWHHDRMIAQGDGAQGAEQQGKSTELYSVPVAIAAPVDLELAVDMAHGVVPLRVLFTDWYFFRISRTSVRSLSYHAHQQCDLSVLVHASPPGQHPKIPNHGVVAAACYDKPHKYSRRAVIPH